MENIDKSHEKSQTIIDYLFIGTSIMIFAIGSFYACGNSAAIGLVLDLSGFLLIFGFGLPSRFATVWDASPRTGLAKALSWVGVALVVSGFIFQYLGSINVNFKSVI